MGRREDDASWIAAVTMPLSVKVHDYLGTQLDRASGPDFDALCKRAANLEQPFLGTIDQYDDTVFNCHQVVRVREEILHVMPADDATVSEAAHRLLELCELVQAKPHRYLVFVGD